MNHAAPTSAFEVHALIEKIAASPGKLDKQELVAQGMHSDLFKRVVIAAYDSFKTYGIAKLPATGGVGKHTLDEETPWTVLLKLANRTLTGTDARDEVEKWLRILTPESSELFRRIVLRDLRAGFTSGTVNKVAPKTFAEFPYMRCSLPAKSNIAKWDWSKGQISQIKADGMFTNVDVHYCGDVELRTRQGNPIDGPAFDALRQDIARTLKHGTQTHGEMLVYHNGSAMPREEGNGVLSHLISGGTLEPLDEVRLQVWDQISMPSVQHGRDDAPYHVRLVALISQTRGKSAVNMVETKVVKSFTEAKAHFKAALSAGLEGTVAKQRDAVWKDGTSKDQVKFKIHAVVDLVVTDIVPGRADTKNEGRPGSLSCETSDGLLQVDVTVKNEAMRDDVESHAHLWRGGIIKVVFNSIMLADEEDEPHSLFLPRMEEACVRADKFEADSFAQVQAIYQAALEAA